MSENKFGVPTEEQLAKINKLAKRTLSADEVFVFPSKLAGDMIIPDRYIQLTKELLDVFAIGANQGVSFLLDHSWHADGFFGVGGRPKAAIPYGRTFNSSFGAGTEEGETVSLNADTYMKRGIEIDSVKTDDLIASIEAGTLFDTSIGFSYNKGICSICGKNYFNGHDCEHYAGKTYEVEDPDGVTRNKLCYIKAYPPGGLWENSAVFDGAYPTAGVLSKTGDVIENESGVFEVVSDLKGIDKPIVATYSQRSGLLTMVKKSEHKKVFSGGTTIPDEEPLSKKGVEKPMNEKLQKMLEDFGVTYKEGETKLDEVLSQVADKYEASIVAAQKNAEPLHFYMTQEAATKELGAEMSADSVLKLAKEGQAFHQSTVDSAIAMGVKAMGNEFPADTWKNTFATMGTKEINDIAKTWETQANASIPDGRLSNPLGKPQASSVPDEAYMVGK